jgi:hypothetical protein
MYRSFLLTICLTLPLFSFQSTSLNSTWQKAFGGSKDDVAKAITSTEDGGAIMISTTRSFGHGKTDINVMKIDNNGAKLWEKNFGGERKERASAITKTKDGGFVIVGTTKSYGKGGYDYYIIKINAQGKKLWERVAGGKNKDEATGVTATKDGGTVIIGSSKSYGKGSYDYYMIKLDSNGSLEWEQTAGGKEWDIPAGVVEMEDGTLLIAGKSESFGENSYDGYVVKLSAEGKFIWEKSFGGKKEDLFHAIAKGKDGGLVLVGTTKSYKDKKGDVYIVLLDKAGKKRLVKTYGDVGKKDRSYAVTALKDGGFAIAGSSRGMSNGREDFLLIMIDKDGKVLGSNHYGGEKEEIAYGITQLKDGGIVLVGDTKTYDHGGSDSFIVKVE